MERNFAALSFLAISFLTGLYLVFFPFPSNPWSLPSDIGANFSKIGEKRGIGNWKESDLENDRLIRQRLSQALGPHLAHNQFVREMSLDVGGEIKEVQVNYTLDESLQNKTEELLKFYKPDYGAVVAIDAVTGAIRAMASFEKGHPSRKNLALKVIYPAASIFKIVTASVALDRYGLSPDTLVMFNGANHTLYKQNVLRTKINRWTREITLREAFARSINTVFGRLTFERMKPEDIYDYATRFGFNSSMTSDLPFDMGFVEVPQEKNFQLAEVVSGYNRITKMSPIQGAMMASAVAATGVMRVPYIVASLSSPISGRTIWQSEPVTAAVIMSEEGALRLKSLMEATITQGTSQKSFRELIRDRRRKFKKLELGGKTGSLQGYNPKGKIDWFVGYAIGGKNDKLAVGVIIVNKNFWVVKSSYIAQALFKQRFMNQLSGKARGTASFVDDP